VHAPDRSVAHSPSMLTPPGDRRGKRLGLLCAFGRSRKRPDQQFGRLPWLAADFLRARFLRAFLAMFMPHFVSGVTPESVMRYRYRRWAPSPATRRPGGSHWRSGPIRALMEIPALMETPACPR